MYDALYLPKSSARRTMMFGCESPGLQVAAAAEASERARRSLNNMAPQSCSLLHRLLK